MIPIEQLIKCLGQMTRGRERGQLEIALAEALLEVLKADAINVYKCQDISGEVFVWRSVETTRSGTRLHDNGLSKPDNIMSLERLPLLKTF